MMMRIWLIPLLLLSGLAQAEGTISAAGRLENLANNSTCSAALVRSDIIVTAAHCGGEGNLVFRLGDGTKSETYPVLEITRHPLYDPDGPRVDWRLRFDIAVGQLAKPVPAPRAVPFSIGEDAAVGEALYIASWRGNEGTRPRQRACHVITGMPGLVTLGCRVRGGESGAPVLRRTDDGLELVAVISSRARLLAQPVAQASNLRLRLPPLLDLVDNQTP